MLFKTILKTFGFGFGIVLLLAMLQCGGKVAPASDLPKDILGISISMSKADAQKRLTEIGHLENEDRETGNLWRLKSDARFSHLAVGYDKEDRIKFVTGLVDKAAKERIQFAAVGDLDQAKKEITATHHRYSWEAAAADGKTAYDVSIYGDNPEYVTIYSLSKKVEPGVPAQKE